MISFFKVAANEIRRCGAFGFAMPGLIELTRILS
jgi:hypothetical protein